VEDPQRQKLRAVITLVAALTALVTSVTSLVKVVDKSLEQISYETLSKKITELQEDNERLHLQFAELSQPPTFTYPYPTPPPAPSASQSFPSPNSSSVSPNSIKGKHPCAPGSPFCGPAMATPPSPTPMPPEPVEVRAKPIRTAPPKWSEVQRKADMF